MSQEIYTNAFEDPESFSDEVLHYVITELNLHTLNAALDIEEIRPVIIQLVRENILAMDEQNRRNLQSMFCSGKQTLVANGQLFAVTRAMLSDIEYIEYTEALMVLNDAANAVLAAESTQSVANPAGSAIDPVYAEEDLPIPGTSEIPTIAPPSYVPPKRPVITDPCGPTDTMPVSATPKTKISMKMCAALLVFLLCGLAGGYFIGQNIGNASGYESGYETGYACGNTDGYDLGYEEGYDIGHDEGYDSGYDSGYDRGYDDSTYALRISQNRTSSYVGNTTTYQTSYIGNTNTYKFHRSSCSYLPETNNRISFSTREDAIASGYIPCAHCNP